MICSKRVDSNTQIERKINVLLVIESLLHSHV